MSFFVDKLEANPAFESPSENSSSFAPAAFVSPILRFLFDVPLDSPHRQCSTRRFHRYYCRTLYLRLAFLRCVLGGVGNYAVDADHFRGLGIEGNATGDESSIAYQSKGVFADVVVLKRNFWVG